MPSAFARVSYYPFNMRFLTGQYLTGTYTDFTSSSDHGRADSQEDHYISYDSAGSTEAQGEEQWEGQQQEWEGKQPVWEQQQQQQGQTFPSAAQQSIQLPSLGMPSGSGQQAQSFPTSYYQYPPTRQQVSSVKPQMSARYGGYKGWR